MTSAYEIPSLLERYELKYLIPESLIQPISDFASSYCHLDRYSEQSPDRFYSIYSLYFDSPDFLFLRNRVAGVENRFNMRIRTYDNERESPCFFEIKQKKNGMVRKYRAKLWDKNWHSILENSDCNPKSCSEKDKIELFVRLASSYGASPKVLSSYRRKALVSDVDDYARVTFDRELQCQGEEQYNLIPDTRRMTAYDNSTVFDAQCNIILELKCYTAAVPLWMIDMIRYFDLRKSSFSKYVNSMQCVWGQFGYDMGDRMTTMP